MPPRPNPAPVAIRPTIGVSDRSAKASLRPSLRRLRTVGVAMVFLLGVGPGLGLSGCASTDAGAGSESAAVTPTPGAVAGAVDPQRGRQGPPRGRGIAEDRGVWLQLLQQHDRIRRTLVHRQEGDLGIVEATTESDDPAVAALIKDHGLAMKQRMATGARVRNWDAVFHELFNRHEFVDLEVTVTDKGVRIVESSRDPETIALLRSHAMGVSEFVRAGPAAAPKQTSRLPVGGPLPPSEVAIGGVPHRFLLGQPSPEQLALLSQQGVGRVVDFRTAGEPGRYDEAAAASKAGLDYVNIPYKGGSQLTEAVLMNAREQYRSAAADGTVLALHCRTGNRVGPGWAMHLALDHGTSIDEAIEWGRRVGMVDPDYERILRETLRDRETSGATDPER
jgi:uncharacterized protein (TIGR01244 family)